ncbi:MAG: MBL fold metallo-hydrolase [Caulobacteraceae bacterium]|nr:MBL fold metallo-hydrolase [Caulobacteraceae bacterium]
MKTFWMLARAALLVAVVAVVGLWLFRGPLSLKLMGRIAEHTLASDPLAALPDGLHVGLCGSGAPLPDATRAGPCTVVVAGRRMFVIDTGQGSVRNLALMNLPPARAEAVLMTHYHSDHIADLGEMMLQHWGAAAATRPMPIYGPTGLDQVVAGFEAAYQLDRGYRIAHHGPKVLPPSGFGAEVHAFAAPRGGPDVVLIDDPDLKVTAFPVDHEPVEPAVGYRFDYKGRKLVVSGDTRLSPRVEAEAQGADVLVHEALSPTLVEVQRQAALAAGRTNLAAIFHDIIGYHTTPEQAAGLAQRAHVRYLLLNHIVPAMPMRSLEGPFLGEARRIFHGPLRVGQDGDFLSMPVGSTRVDRSNRLNHWL